MDKRTSRRDFLRGVRATDEDAQRRAEAGERPESESLLIRATRRAMACQFEAVFNAGQYENDTEAALRALDEVDRLEDQLSYFRATSEIARINVLAAEEPVEVEPRLFDLLKLAMQLHAETEGAFDIAAGALWEAWGFSRRQGSVPSEEAIADALEKSGSQHVELDESNRTVRLKRPGVRLNLGAIGKGYALDRAGAIVAAAGIEDYLLHGGQSSVLARGSRRDAPFDRPPLQPGWSVGIRDPLKPEHRLTELRLEDRTLGTSGSAMQFFRHRGRRYSHIVDPRTGWPAEGVLSATVLAPSAAIADALSTAMFVKGPDWADAFCRKRPDIAAVLVCSSGDRHGYRIRTFGLSERDFTPFSPG